MFRRLRIALLWTLAVLVATSLVFSGGVVVGYKAPMDYFVTKVSEKLREILAGRGVADTQEFEWGHISTMFHELELLKVPVAPLGDGGALELAGDNVIFVSAAGFIGYLNPSNALRYTGLRVPTRVNELVASESFKLPRFEPEKFRVMDMLVVPGNEGAFDLYVSHHRFDGDCISLVLSRIALMERNGEIEPKAGAQWETVHQVKPCVPIVRDERRRAFIGEESGGRLLRLSDTTLLMSTGDHGHNGVDRPERYSQDSTSELGKILLIDIASGRAEIYASGFRNPQGLTLTGSGEIWETEHGPRGGDEVNLVRQGVDYGWPSATLGTAYDGNLWPIDSSRGRHDGFQKPSYAFVPAIGISNLVEVRGAEFPLWRDDLLVGSLRGLALHRLRRNGEAIVYDETIFLNDRVRDMVQRADGQLVIYTNNGELIFVRNAKSDRPHGSVTFTGLKAIRDVWQQTWHAATEDATPAERGHIAFGRACGTCHTTVEENGIGPHLKGVLGRKVGSVENFAYSSALKSSDLHWSDSLMERYLTDPQEVFPGSAMPTPQLTGNEMDDVIEYLRSTK
jgi:cytochrome c2